MDFSQAERLGFINAFITFWKTQAKNSRSDEELKAAAERLLRGCAEHFRRNVTRVSKISAVVEPEKAEFFKGRALSLLKAENTNDFRIRAAHLVEEFPLVKPWLNWWLHESRASMLFKSERKMKPDIWEAIPDTTNAEEAMHHVFYAAAGRNHDLLEGCNALFALNLHFLTQYKQAEGAIILQLKSL